MGVMISRPDKLWWPDEGITKLDVVRFYADVAPRLLPWMRDRLITAERCPDGMRGECFFQKDFGTGLPAGVPTVPVAAASTGRTVRYVVGGSRKTLLALVNLGCIAIHLMNCRRRSPQRPDWLAFDLDPGTGAFADAARAGRLLRDILDERRLRSYPKTSGGRGLHVLVPLRPGPSQDEVRAFAREIGRVMAERAPGLVTVEMSRGRRRRRVFIDVLRNAFGQTIVAPYSVRRWPEAPISTPLDWDEVPHCTSCARSIADWRMPIRGPTSGYVGNPCSRWPERSPHRAHPGCRVRFHPAPILSATRPFGRPSDRLARSFGCVFTRWRSGRGRER
jgi:bifunctional non-homologous end joining protein LigD